MDKSYDPKLYESDTYQKWIENQTGLYKSIKTQVDQTSQSYQSEPQVWELNFRTDAQRVTLQSILDGTKTIETRALNPEEPDRYFGAIKSGDFIIFHDVEAKKKYYFEVSKTELFRDLEEAYQKNLDFSKVSESFTAESGLSEIADLYIGKLGKNYYEKILKNGFVAIYLGKQLDPRHNDLDWEKLLKKPKLVSFIMPPPNLTGSLHLGHVLEHSVYDTYLRYNQMQGRPAVFLPGVDHAGIQFEGTIEKNLKKEGTSKEEIGFDEFIKRSWEFATKSKDNIKQIAESVGELPAWDKMHFTMDDASVAAVRGAFFDYWQNDWVYKGTSMVNWSVGLQTAVSEVFGDIEWEERKDPFVTFEYEAKRWQKNEKLNLKNEKLVEFGHTYLKETSKWPRLRLSTVRIETKFTDLAVAMHPSKFEIYFNLAMFEVEKPGFDEKLALEFINAVKNLEIEVFYHLPPLESDELKLILSDKVLADFGTGIVKITPAHDPFDYQLYLEFIEAGLLDKNKEIKQAVGRDGRLTSVCGEFAGMTVEEARPLIVEKLIIAGYIPKKSEKPEN